MVVGSLRIWPPYRLADAPAGWHRRMVFVTPDPSAPTVIYDRMTWNTPLSDDHASLLLDLLEPAPVREVLDLGCGWGSCCSGSSHELPGPAAPASTAWLQSYPHDPRAPEVRALLDDRLHEYVTVYRRVLGFAYLVLA